jgi:hypothetical protein
MWNEKAIEELLKTISKTKCQIKGCSNRPRTQCNKCDKFICTEHTIFEGDWVFPMPLCPTCR